MRPRRVVPLLLGLAAAASTSTDAAATRAAAPADDAAPPPNVLFIVADDLGLNDVPFTGTGSEVKAPHLQALAEGGTVLRHYYVNAICTPTRASFMSAKYPIHVGLQHGVIRDSVPDGMPLSEKLLPEVFHDAGYSTHMVGKWHLGFYTEAYVPERRGFDEHFGYYTGNEEYWNHTSPAWSSGNYTALDFHRANATHFEPLTNFTDEYSTIVFAQEVQAILRRVTTGQQARRPFFIYAPFEAVHGASSCYVEGQAPNCEHPDGDELQAPQNYIDEQAHIPSKNRRTFAGMVGALDAAVANITATLRETGLLDSTLIVFTTDNGAPNSHFDGATMSNYPLRGGKGTLWEGGQHGAAFVYGPQVGVPAGAVHRTLMHASDWLPTLAEAAGVALPAAYVAGLDGVSLWSSIANASSIPSTDDDSFSGSAGNGSWPGVLPVYGPRTEILHNIDPTTAGNTSAIRVRDYKLLVHVPDAGWGPQLPPPASAAVPATSSLPAPSTAHGGSSGSRGSAGGTGSHLYNIAQDPEERHDLYGDPQYAEVQAHLEARLAFYASTMLPCRNPDPDPAAVPRLVPGLDICTPSPIGPILCGDVGVWRPWRNDSRVLVV